MFYFFMVWFGPQFLSHGPVGFIVQLGTNVRFFMKPEFDAGFAKHKPKVNELKNKTHFYQTLDIVC